MQCIKCVLTQSQWVNPWYRTGAGQIFETCCQCIKSWIKSCHSHSVLPPDTKLFPSANKSQSQWGNSWYRTGTGHILYTCCQGIKSRHRSQCINSWYKSHACRYVILFPFVPWTDYIRDPKELIKYNIKLPSLWFHNWNWIAVYSQVWSLAIAPQALSRSQVFLWESHIVVC